VGEPRMTFDVHEELLQRAMRVWGGPSRLEKLAEECAELIAEIQKYKGGRSSLAGLCDEMADVYITLANVAALIDDNHPCDMALRRKLAKFRGQVDEAERVGGGK
jgi:NTP pyrophosphatase (non-canonical NTP hydrolase)